MGSGHHHTGHGTHLADGIAELRCRTDIVEEEDVQAVRLEHVSGNLCEKLAVVAAVE